MRANGSTVSEMNECQTQWPRIRAYAYHTRVSERLPFLNPQFLYLEFELLGIFRDRERERIQNETVTGALVVISPGASTNGKQQ